MKLASAHGPALLAAALLLAAPGLRAETLGKGDLPGIDGKQANGTTNVKPRLFVIFDTSTSMRYPKTGAQTPYADDLPANYSVGTKLPENSCRSKFCIGKQALFDTLYRFTVSSQNKMSIGLAGYYQYLMVHVPKDLLSTLCTYDILANPGDVTYTVTDANNWGEAGEDFPKALGPKPAMALKSLDANGVNVGGYGQCKANAAETYEVTRTDVHRERHVWSRYASTPSSFKPDSAKVHWPAGIQTDVTWTLDTSVQPTCDGVGGGCSGSPLYYQVVQGGNEKCGSGGGYYTFNLGAALPQGTPAAADIKTIRYWGNPELKCTCQTCDGYGTCWPDCCSAITPVSADCANSADPGGANCANTVNLGGAGIGQWGIRGLSATAANEQLKKDCLSDGASGGVSCRMYLADNKPIDPFTSHVSFSWYAFFADAQVAQATYRDSMNYSIRTKQGNPPMTVAKLQDTGYSYRWRFKTGPVGSNTVDNCPASGVFTGGALATTYRLNGNGEELDANDAPVGVASTLYRAIENAGLPPAHPDESPRKNELSPYGQFKCSADWPCLLTKTKAVPEEVDQPIVAYQDPSYLLAQGYTLDPAYPNQPYKDDNGGSYYNFYPCQTSKTGTCLHSNTGTPNTCTSACCGTYQTTCPDAYGVPQPCTKNSTCSLPECCGTSTTVANTCKSFCCGSYTEPCINSYGNPDTCTYPKECTSAACCGTTTQWVCDTPADETSPVRVTSVGDCGSSATGACDYVQVGGEQTDTNTCPVVYTYDVHYQPRCGPGGTIVYDQKSIASWDPGPTVPLACDGSGQCPERDISVIRGTNKVCSGGSNCVTSHYGSTTASHEVVSTGGNVEYPITVTSAPPAGKYVTEAGWTCTMDPGQPSYGTPFGVQATGIYEPDNHANGLCPGGANGGYLACDANGASGDCTAGAIGTVSDPGLCGTEPSCDGKLESVDCMVGPDGFPWCTCNFTKAFYKWTCVKDTVSTDTCVCNYNTRAHFQWSSSQNQTTSCNYFRYVWHLQKPKQYVWNCYYQMPVRRYDFVDVPRTQQCPYFRIAHPYYWDELTYTYQWKAKGGEVIDQATLTVSGQNYCPLTDANGCCTTWSAGNDFGKACPVVGGPEVDPRCATHQCLLRQRGRTVPVPFQSRDANFASFAASPLFQVAESEIAVNRTNDLENCVAGDYYQDAANPPSAEDRTHWGSLTWDPDKYKCDWGKKGDGHKDYELIADYYNPLEANDLDAFVAKWPTSLKARETFAWNNQAAKWSGWGRTEPPSGAKIPASVFVPIPEDDLASNYDALKTAAGPCDPPNESTNINIDAEGRYSYTPKGLCTMSDWTRPPKYCPDLRYAPGMPTANPDYCRMLEDYTPLYGSITNAYDYIKEVIERDPKKECRSYGVLLITDGVEFDGRDHPNLFSLSQITTKVSQLFGLSKMGVTTNVIGFWGLKDSERATLDAIARAGHARKNGAYFASSGADLALDLVSVFQEQQTGYYSRAKPALNTDGTRLYGTYFAVDGKTNEWSGGMKAFRLEAGQPVVEWDAAERINAVTDPARRLFVESSDHAGLKVFEAANADLLAMARSDAAFPAATMKDTDVVTFFRNASLNTPFFYPNLFPEPTRKSRLGALVHSTPVAVGRSVNALSYAGSSAAAQAAYRVFQDTPRATRIYVGSNDGFLRAIKDGESTPAHDGTEAWGFMPAAVVKHLYREMLGDHQAGTDNTPVLADVCRKESGVAGCPTADWGTYLFGTLRGGGASIFALDVTDTTTPAFLWSYTNLHLGNTWSAPAIGRVPYSGGTYVAVFGGGMGPNAGYTFVLNAHTGAELSVKPLPAGLPGDPTPQLLARPEVFRKADDVDNPEYIRSAVAGDTAGRLDIIRFDAGGPAVWEPKVFFDPRTASGGRVFTVRQTGGWAEEDWYPDGTHATLPLLEAPPIFIRARSMLGKNPENPIYVAGTGHAQNAANMSDPNLGHPSLNNYVYAVRDDGNATGTPLWVFKLPNPYEQIVGEPLVTPEIVVIATYVPPVAGADCGEFGDSILYSLSLEKGELSKSLQVYDATGKPEGNPTSVLVNKNSGLLSDLVMVEGSMYYMKENHGANVSPDRVGVNATLSGGGLRTWRRIK